MKLEKKTMSNGSHLLNDVYYKKEYVNLYLNEEDTLFEFYYSRGEEFLYNIALKGPIKRIGNILVNDGFYDPETAYGYGGILTNSQNTFFLNETLESYYKKCMEERIIAEFFRFHPFNIFPEINPDFFDFSKLDRKVVYVDLTLSREERWANYSQTLRNDLRKSQKSGYYF